jgi:hypothetical protein
MDRISPFMLALMLFMTVSLAVFWSLFPVAEESATEASQKETP